MQIVRIGLSLAKYVFEVHGVDAHGKIIVLRRDGVSIFFKHSTYLFDFEPTCYFARRTASRNAL
jgi:hypothetical protein